jgi:hypothetical protein
VNLAVTSHICTTAAKARPQVNHEARSAAAVSAELEVLAPVAADKIGGAAIVAAPRAPPAASAPLSRA